MGLARTAVGGIVSGVKLAIGFANYLLVDRTPPYAHLSMINLFCLTAGHSNDFLSLLIACFRRPYRFEAPSGVLGDMSGVTKSEVIRSLNTHGYHVFEKRLPADVCDRLMLFATSVPCDARQMDAAVDWMPERAVYDRGSPRAVRYDFETQALLDNADIQALLADVSLAAVAQEYLGARPAIDVLSMWWHTSFSDKPDSEAAQFFHFDMDRPKWLKVFIYLTDVTAENGPHTFVAGSHKTGGIPRRLLEKRYARLTDQEVGACYSPDRIIEFTAPRGTIIVEDTRGLHKGRHVEREDRLMLQLQFSNSLFGAIYKKSKFGEVRIDELRRRIKEYPSMFSAYL